MGALEENGGRERWLTTTGQRTLWLAICFSAVPYRT